jgi:hypothetical protein
MPAVSAQVFERAMNKAVSLIVAALTCRVRATAVHPGGIQTELGRYMTHEVT